jgi:murein L,D-transpeptidase YcbB/YkuD
MKFSVNKDTATSCQTAFTMRTWCLLTAAMLLGLVACNNDTPVKITQKEIVTTPQQMDEKLPVLIKEALKAAMQNNGKYDSLISFSQAEVLEYLYDQNDHAARWSRNERWTMQKDSLLDFIRNAKLYGLFPEDYHLAMIDTVLKRFVTDSLSKADRKDAVLWAKTDVMLTDAFIRIIHDIKLGRLQKDSITLRTDSVITNEFYKSELDKFWQSFSMTRVVNEIEPALRGYQELKAAIKPFLDSASFKKYTYVPFPVYDSVKFRQAIEARLYEDSLIAVPDSLTDSLSIAAGIKKFQLRNKLKADGKAGAETVRMMNLTDEDKFMRIAISMDKYKMLPPALPEKYIWVNLAGYYLQLWEGDTMRIYSKVVVGKPLTRTPELNSSIYEMITYPQWTIPTSIIVKEVLPGLKKSPAYLEKKGYSLLNGKNEEVDPYFVDWSQYKTGIPYKVVQGSGDANALGVMKFNFPNKYAVYLHDTNQRYLFSQTTRALSHGCVRVQEWQKLTHYIINNDSTNAKAQTSYTKTDSVLQWLQKKEKHAIPVRNRIPLFIRYFTCEGKDGRLVFYDDIYNEDRWLREKYFAGR